MKAKLTNIKDKLVDALNELNDEHWLAIFGFFMVALVIGSMIIAPISASASNYEATMILKSGTYTFKNELPFVPFDDAWFGENIYFNFKFVNPNDKEDGIGILIEQVENEEIAISIIPTDHATFPVYDNKEGWKLKWSNGVITGKTIYIETDQTITTEYDTDDVEYANAIKTAFMSWFIEATNYNEVNGDTPLECPTLEEQIANYNGTWTEFLMMLRQNNRTLANSYQNNIDLAIQSGFQNGKEQGFNEGFSEGHTEGYAEGFNAGLNGGANRDPIDQYWNSTKDYILIAGQPYFAPNGFGSIDQYNTVGIYGEHESKLHRADGTTQTFNGQFVTQFASAGTLGGGWYKIGATVGDEFAYEQSFNVSAMDKAYYVSRVSPLGDPVEEFLVAIWLDDYGAWYVAEEYVHYGTVANNDKSYKQVYSIYMTDIRPTSQRFVNYDNPTLHETFNEDINATLYLATFNQLNNYNVYTDDIGIVESYNKGFDAGANTTLWTDLISQPIVAFFSIPLAQVIVEGVTYTLTYGIVLGAGIVGLIVIWFLKLFAGG